MYTVLGAVGESRGLVDYSVELAVTFDGGAGLTRSVSRDVVRFVTDVPLVPGRIVNGTLSTIGDGDSPATTLGYRARVTRIRRRPDPGTFEVEARLEWLDFVAAEPSSPSASTPCLKPKPHPA